MDILHGVVKTYYCMKQTKQQFKNLVPRVLRLLGQRVVAGRDWGDNGIVTAKESLSPFDHPLTKKPEDAGYEIDEIVTSLKCHLGKGSDQQKLFWASHALLGCGTHGTSSLA